MSRLGPHTAPTQRQRVPQRFGGPTVSPGGYSDSTKRSVEKRQHRQRQATCGARSACFGTRTRTHPLGQYVKSGCP